MQKMDSAGNNHICCCGGRTDFNQYESTMVNKVDFSRKEMEEGQMREAHVP